MSEICTIQQLTALVIYRTSQLSSGKPPMISNEEIEKLNYDMIKIAEVEVKRGLVDFSLKIKRPGGDYTFIESSSELIYN
jgi:DNA-directed RNA polymerase subunit K/omega